MSSDSTVGSEVRRFYPTFDAVSPTAAVVESVASVTGQSPHDLDPLGNVFDPDSFNRLVSNSDDITISFEFENLDIEVNSSGVITVYS